MSETTDFYSSWLGCSAFGAVNNRIRAEEPIVFSPTDLSNCDIWFDANNPTTITTDPFGGYVTTWSNLGNYGGLASNVDTSNVIYTGTQTINFLNVLDFNSNAAMTFPFAKPSYDTTLFVVSQPITNLSTNFRPNIDWFNPVGYNGFLGAGMGYEPTFTPPWFYATAASGYYFSCLGADSNDPTGRPISVCIRTTSDTSGNIVTLNGSNLTLLYQDNAVYSSDLVPYYIGSTVYNSQFWMAEMIIYDRKLTDEEVAQVTTYLQAKWAIT